MNEKLKELAEQAGIPTYYPEGISERLEKFAQLMVFECVNAVMDGTKEGDHYAQRIEGSRKFCRKLWS